MLIYVTNIEFIKNIQKNLIYLNFMLIDVNNIVKNIFFKYFSLF
jgi:hypothetical protein